MQRLEADLNDLRVKLNKEHQARIQAEQQAAVLTAKLESVTDRAAKAELAANQAINEMKQARDEAAEIRGKFAGK